MLDIRFTLPAAPFVLPVVAIVLIVLLYRWKQHKISAQSTLWAGALTVYTGAVVWLTQFPLQVVIGRYAGGIKFNSLHYVPVVTIDLKTFLLNVILFLPLGFLLPLATRFRSPGVVVLCGALLSVTIETVQLVTSVFLDSGRATDINDVIANTLGTFLGLLVLLLFARTPLGGRVHTPQVKQVW